MQIKGVRLLLCVRSLAQRLAYVMVAGAIGGVLVIPHAKAAEGAKLGANESRVYGVGPILTLTLGSNPVTALTLVAKGYHKFDAEKHT
jgi:hypothetical protein